MMDVVQVGWVWGIGKLGDECSITWERWRKTSVQTFSHLFLETLTEGAVTTEAESLLQYFITLTENAGPLLWLAPWRTLYGCPSKAASSGRGEVEANSEIKIDDIIHHARIM